LSPSYSGPLSDPSAESPKALTVEFRSKELLDDPSADSARTRLDAGMAKLCTEPAYEAKGLDIIAEFDLRDGDFARPNIEDDPTIGDFVRAAAAKGDDADANAANPSRLVAVGAMIDDWLAVALVAFGSGGATVEVELPENGGGEGVTLPDLNIF
jgi:hypothetical protein